MTPLNALIMITVLVIIYFISTRYLFGNSDNVANSSAKLSVSDSGITIVKTEQFSTIFPNLKSQYPVYTMIQPTSQNIKAVNELDPNAWNMIMGLKDTCDDEYKAACKTYGIKNKGQFRTHLDTFRKWLNLLDTAALTKLANHFTSAGIRYDFDNNILTVDKYVVLPITSKNTPIVESVMINSIPLPTMYTLYTTYTMIVMTMYKVMGKDISVEFDVMWIPISSKEYTELLNKASNVLAINTQHL